MGEEAKDPLVVKSVVASNTISISVLMDILLYSGTDS